MKTDPKSTRYMILFWIVFAILSVFTAVSCKRHTIQQDVTRVNRSLYLRTIIWDGGGLLDISSEIIHSWYDEEITDSIKCLRYKQATELIKKIEEVENYKCK